LVLTRAYSAARLVGLFTDDIYAILVKFQSPKTNLFFTQASLFVIGSRCAKEGCIDGSNETTMSQMLKALRSG